MKPGTLEYGAMQAIENCIKLKPEEKLVLITDEETMKIGDAVKKAAQKVTKDIEVYILEDFGERPDDGVNSLKFPDELEQALRRADASIYCASSHKKNEIRSLRLPMIYVIKEQWQKGKLRHGHMPDIKEEMMITGMSADYAEIQALSARLYDILKDAKEMRITTEKGTDLLAKFVRRGANKRIWQVSDGDIASMKKPIYNLPDGEIYTTPFYISGHVVIDGCLGDQFKKYGDIGLNPVEFDIRRARIVPGTVKCDNPELEAELIKYIFETDKNSNRIGEVGLGTNIFLKAIIGELLQDEKFPGVHIAWGDPCFGMTGAKWKSKVHCDGVIRDTYIWVDGLYVMEKGKYLI